MVSREITSLQHPIVKRMVKLREDRSFREQEKSALIVGKKLVEELSSSIKTLITTQTFSHWKAPEHFIGNDAILKKITGVKCPEGVAAEVALPSPGNLKGKKFLLALDAVADPGNLGTLLRTALALGFEGAFLTESSVDPFNEKAIRAARGASFHLPLRCGKWDELADLSSGMQIYVADAKGKPLKEIDFRPPLVLVLGNEARGLSMDAKNQGMPVAIPMQKMESLNVAIAGAILMFQMRKL